MFIFRLLLTSVRTELRQAPGLAPKPPALLQPTQACPGLPWLEEGALRIDRRPSPAPFPQAACSTPERGAEPSAEAGAGIHSIPTEAEKMLGVVVQPPWRPRRPPTGLLLLRSHDVLLQNHIKTPLNAVAPKCEGCCSPSSPWSTIPERLPSSRRLAPL